MVNIGVFFFFQVLNYLRSPNWDTRIAAGQAVEAVVKNIPEWDPAPKPKKGKPIEHSLVNQGTFSTKTCYTSHPRPLIWILGWIALKRLWQWLKALHLRLIFYEKQKLLWLLFSFCVLQVCFGILSLCFGILNLWHFAPNCNHTLPCKHNHWTNICSWKISKLKVT